MEEKLLTIAIPCYNSQGYMRHAVDSLLHVQEGLEILITTMVNRRYGADRRMIMPGAIRIPSVPCISAMAAMAGPS